MKPVGRRAVLLGIASVGLFPGCSAYEYLFGTTVFVRWIEIRSADGMNENSPVALDLVHLAGNQTLIEEVAKMSAEDWFNRKNQLRRDFRDELDIRGWEVVPGQVLTRSRLDRPKVDRAAFLFARYSAPGAHRYRLTDRDTDISVQLDTASFLVTTK